MKEGDQQMTQLLQQAIEIIEFEKELRYIMLSEKVPSNNDHIEVQERDNTMVIDKHNLNKRGAFDSIAHGGDFGGFESDPVPKKLEFTFKNLLPYLIRLRELRKIRQSQ